eukprot:COSAG05_NODE_801_length_7224_cov_4.552000_16_plen_105_part_00
MLDHHLELQKGGVAEGMSLSSDSKHVEKLKKEMAKQDAALRKYEAEVSELRQAHIPAGERARPIKFVFSRIVCDPPYIFLQRARCMDDSNLYLGKRRVVCLPAG